MTVKIVIDVAGEVAGSPGVARTFDYTKVYPTPPLVTLSLDDNTGITTYAWEIVAQPEGVAVTLSDPAVPSPTFTPAASIPGTYLVECVVNGGDQEARNGLAFRTENLGLRKPAPGETTQFSSDRGWEIALAKLIDAVDSLLSSGGVRQRKVIDIVNNTAAPPSEVSGDRYILDATSGGVHANWDGASPNDIVMFDGALWQASTPEEGWVAYADLKDSDYRFVDDGTPIWEQVTAGDITTVWNGTTTDATVTEIYLNGAPGSQYPVSANSCVGFLINVLARDNTNNETMRWKVEGAIQRDGAGNTSIVGSSVVVSVLAEPVAGLSWDVTAVADDTTDSLAIKVTGEAGKTITWRADGFITSLS